MLDPTATLDMIRVAQGSYSALQLVKTSPSDMIKTLNALREQDG